MTVFPVYCQTWWWITSICPFPGFNQLMMHTDTNEENLGAYIKLLDAALQHEVCILGARAGLYTLVSELG